jgi:Flp pilus assembly protein TadG
MGAQWTGIRGPAGGELRRTMARHKAALGFLTRLRKDVRGNTLAIMAAAIVPLIGMVGGAVDLSRLYLTRVRLQHACDAGALAGRKQMGGGAWSTTAQTSANQFFWANFRQRAYGTGTATVAFTSSGTDVQGTASTTVPMTLMAFFSAPTRTIGVSCDSQMQLPNTDVMFVLDNTGSMADKANSSDSANKIDTLKNAVKCFYEALAQYKTDGTCTTPISGTGINSDSQLRFGFVPYTTNVNVSQLGLPASYFASTWNYQSRLQSGSWGSWTNTNKSCSNVPANTSTVKYQTVTTFGIFCTVQSSTYGQAWLYGSVQQSLNMTSALAAFNVSKPPSSTTITLPIGNNYTNRNVQWDGCLEEQTPTSNINQIPSQSDASTLYAPALPDAIYLRNSGTGSLDSSSMTTASSTTTSNYYNSVRANDYFCPTPAKKLQAWSVANFDTYVDSLYAAGNTYHDIGMLWGGRMISPEGMFKSDNAQTPTGGRIMRHVIFMTDGDAQAAACDYTVYGIAWYDNRTGSNVGTASRCETGAGVNTHPTYNSLWSDLNTRLLALCSSVKNEPDTTLWVISFGGSGIDPSTKTNLQTCATDSNHYFDATSAAQLNSAFQMIAAQISQLRLTQ